MSAEGCRFMQDLTTSYGTEKWRSDSFHEPNGFLINEIGRTELILIRKLKTTER